MIVLKAMTLFLVGTTLGLGILSAIHMPIRTYDALALQNLNR